MKKIFALILALVMVLSLAACGGDKGGAVAGGNTESTNNTSDTSDTTKNTSQDTTEDTPENTGGDATENTTVDTTEDTTNDTSENSNENAVGNTTGTNNPPSGNATGNTVENNPTSHSHIYSSQITDPTCTVGGYTTYTCSCGDSYNANYTNARGHRITESSYGFVKSTCCTEGRYGAKEYCYACNTVFKEGDVLPKSSSNHIGTPYIINKKEATWTQAGYTGDVCCDGCKNNIHPQNKGKVVSAHCDHSTATKSYLAENDKIKYECSQHGYIEHIDPDPISIQMINVPMSLTLPGEGVRGVAFSVVGGSLDYTVLKYEIISPYQNVPKSFGEIRQYTGFNNQYIIPLISEYTIPDGTQVRLMINDSSGRTFDKVYTVRQHSWNDYEVIENS